jgi:hypothetical protein
MNLLNKIMNITSMYLIIISGLFYLDDLYIYFFLLFFSFEEAESR